MIQSAPRILLLAALAVPALALRRQGGAAVVASAVDPNARGQMFQFQEHQPWVTSLFDNRTLAEQEAAKKYPESFELMKQGLKHPVDYAAQLGACGAIAEAVNSNHVAKPYLAAAGGINLTTAALRKNLGRTEPEQKNLHRVCTRALGLLSLYQHDVQEVAGEAGAVELVLDVQRRWKDDPEMQMGGLSGCFLDFSEKNRGRWAQAGGIKYTIETIRRHYQNGMVMEQCWFAFSSGTQPPNQRAFVEAGGVVEAVRAMRHHKRSGRVREEAMQAMRAVGRCGGCGDLQSSIVQEGFIEELAVAMREVPNDIHIQSPACANVQILSWASAANRARAVKAGLTELALKAVRNFPSMVSSVNWAFDDQYTVYEDCVTALASLAKDGQGKAILLKESALKDVDAAAERKPQSRMLQWGARQVREALAAA